MIPTYNTLNNNGELQSKVTSSYVQDLADIFVKHDAHHCLGMRLIHGQNTRFFKFNLKNLKVKKLKNIYYIFFF